MEDELKALDRKAKIFERETNLETLRCCSVSQAKMILQDADHDIVCIVTDLCMPSDGLTSEQQKETDGNERTGWVWLWYYVRTHERYRNVRVIIYSEFIGELESYLSGQNDQEKKDYYDTLVRIPRSRGVDNREKLIEAVKGALKVSERSSKS